MLWMTILHVIDLSRFDFAPIPPSAGRLPLDKTGAPKRVSRYKRRSFRDLALVTPAQFTEVSAPKP